MKNRNSIILLLATALIFFSFWVYYYTSSRLLPSLTDRGLFGDSFGFLNAFYSSLALLGIIYTIFQQNEQIKQSKIDTEIALKQIQESIRQFEHQQKIQTFATLIELTEKKLLKYKSINDPSLIVETEKKLVDLTIELNKLLS